MTVTGKSTAGSRKALSILASFRPECDNCTLGGKLNRTALTSHSLTPNFSLILARSFWRDFYLSEGSFQTNRYIFTTIVRGVIGQAFN